MLTPLLKWTQIGSIRNSFKSLKDSWDRNCHEAELDYLLSKSEHNDFNIVDWEGWYPLHRAIMLANIEILKKLLQKGANPNLNVKGYLSPLCKAILEGKEDIVTFLIENGADVNMVDGQDCTPVTLAIFRENIEILKTLLQKGATDT